MKQADIKLGKTILFQESACPSMVAWHIGATEIDQTNDASDRKCTGEKTLQGKCLCVNSVFLSLLTFLYSLYNFFTLSMDYFYNWKKTNAKTNQVFLFTNSSVSPI